MVNTSKQANKLIDEKSPYLLQHAYNPVDWYPWGKEAFDTATSYNKPIFLSIGYSTCHWCHVMERESFEDTKIASLLKRYFVSIKVDREERPDIDHLYMEFCQALTGSGGWPLTILMTPEKEPFLAGTYFPKTQRYGRAGLMEILNQVGNAWLTRESDLRQSAREIVHAVQTKNLSTVNQKTLSSGIQPKPQNLTQVLSTGDNSILYRAYDTLKRSFDSQYGGFSRAPKFPTPHALGFLLRYARIHPESQALMMVQKTLDGTAKGGIYDHIGFGFARYSTDEKWLVPHFEKMLYDNALLALAYLESYQMYHRKEDALIAQEIFTYILRDMTSSEGGFYSAEDADSEGVEGKFYVWTLEEVRAILGDYKADLFCAAYNITSEGNFEGKSIPNLITTNLEQLAKTDQLTMNDLHIVLEESRQLLFKARNERVHPYKDDKILTSWNGLMITALAKGSQILGNKSYLEAAEKALDFILKYLRRGDGRLLARYRDGHADHLGYLDDYANMISGLLELYTTSGIARYLQIAMELQEQQNLLFTDNMGGGFFLTGSDAEELLFRPKEFYDGALPSGNSVSTLNLLRLARITADFKWEYLADRQLAAFPEEMKKYPSNYTAFLQAVQFAFYGTQELVLAGPLDAPSLTAMRQVYFSDFRPFATLLYQEGSLDKYVPWVKDYPVDEERTTAYLCKDLACQAPVNTPENLASLLNQP
ncbi:MAG: thioredoxin domain-containing protein [Desulfitobacteriaceae bacterium]